MNKQEELKPCPLCGAKAVIMNIGAHQHVIATWMPDYTGGAFIECTSCTCCLSARTEAEAITAWNKRAGTVGD